MKDTAKRLDELDNLAKGIEQNVYTSCLVNIFPEDFDNIYWAVKTIKNQNEKIQVYEKELDRLYKDRYQNPKAVAELVKLRAWMFTCSYKVAWENYVEKDEKFNFTFEQIKDYLER